jgi:hypothetical protein
MCVAFQADSSAIHICFRKKIVGILDTRQYESNTLALALHSKLFVNKKFEGRKKIRNLPGMLCRKSDSWAVSNSKCGKQGNR